jgi:sulfur-carrier protein
MRVVYFAATREAIGLDGEDIVFPASAATIGDALDYLAGQSDRHATAFVDLTKLRFALDQQMVKADAALGQASELAIFPPVTGG